MEVKKLQFFESPLSGLLSDVASYHDQIEDDIKDIYNQFPRIVTVVEALVEGSYYKLDRIRRALKLTDEKYINYIMQELIDKQYHDEIIKLLDAHYDVAVNQSIDKLNESNLLLEWKVKEYINVTIPDENIRYAVWLNLGRYIKNQYTLFIATEIAKIYKLTPFNPQDMLHEFTEEGKEICRSDGFELDEIKRERPIHIVAYNFNQMMYDLTPVVKNTICNKVWVAEHYWHAYHTNPNFINYTTLVELSHYEHPNNRL